jgi:RNA polymerase sigma factor (sigma-70 family)
MRSYGDEKMKKTMTIEDTVIMCERLARKTGRPQHYEDLVSEGVLKSLEVLHETPDTHPANVYRAARKRMYDYINFDCHGLSVPASDAARSIARGNDTTDRDDYSERGLELLRATLDSEWGEYDEDFVESYLPTAEETLINKDTGETLTRLIFEVLTEDEADLIILRYFEEATQDEVADLYGMTQQAVSLRESRALRKLKIRLCNIL